MKALTILFAILLSTLAAVANDDADEVVNCPTRDEAKVLVEKYLAERDPDSILEFDSLRVTPEENGTCYIQFWANGTKQCVDRGTTTIIGGLVTFNGKVLRGGHSCDDY